MRRLLLAATIALLPGAAGAHGTGARVSADRAVVVALHYTDGEPMSFADVYVFAPDETGAYLHTRADRQGRVAFVPDRDGGWRVDGRDSEGHTARIAVPVADRATPAGPGGMPAWMLWASLALNLFAAAEFWSRYAPSRRAGSPRPA